MNNNTNININIINKDDNINNRVVELGRQVWSLLTEDEQDKYYNIGTLTFVEDIVAILNSSDFDWDSVETLEAVHDGIFNC